MGEGQRAFDRVFSQAVAAVSNAYELQDTEKQREREQLGEDAHMRRMTTGMTADDAIKRILLAEKDKDYFRILELPQPELDALGRAAWGVAPADVSKAYRKLSILVHPDKNPGDEARQAFEALNQAHRMLKDPGKLEGVLRDHLDKARARRAELEGRATLEERVALNAQQKGQAKELRRAEAESLNAEVLRQMQERQERAKRKKEAGSSSRYRRRDEGESGDDSGDGQGTEGADTRRQADERGDSDEEDAKQRRLAMAKRRQKQRKVSAI